MTALMWLTAAGYAVATAFGAMTTYAMFAFAPRLLALAFAGLTAAWAGLCIVHTLRAIG